MSYWGDFPLEETLNFLFTTRAFATGVPTVLAGSPTLSVYEDVNLTQITSGVTLTVDHDSVVGLNRANIVAVAANGYEAGKTYTVIIANGTVGGVSVVGEVIGHFTIDRSAALRPTTAGRTLDVAATGQVGLDFGNATGSITGGELGVGAFATAAITAAAIATDAIGSAELATDAIGDAQIATGAIASTAFAAGAINAAAIATDAIGSAELATTAVNEIRDAMLSDSTPFAGANIAAILTDTGTTLDTKINDIQGATFSSATDSLQAIRDRGDAAWTTGAGGSDRLLMVDTTIATLASQVSFTLTAGSADNNAYENCTAVIEDAATATQKAIGLISAYVGSTKTVTLKYDPAVFTMAATDKIYILAENALKSTDRNRQLDVTTTGAAGIDWSNVENPTATVDLSDTDIQLCDTITTYTGDTPQTGDNFVRLGAPAGASVSVDIAAVKVDTAAILVDTGTTLDTKINDIQGATFSSVTDSLEAIRDRGDAAWTTGAGGSDRLLMVDTTIATLATQVSFTLTAGSADDDAYNNCTIVVEDVSTATQKAVGMVLDYTGSSKTVTLKEALAFTISTTDKVYILAENALKSTVANRQLDVTATGAAGIDWGNVENPTTVVDLSGTDIQLCDTITTYTGDTPQTGDNFARLGAPAGASVSADIADVPTVAEFDARTLIAASYFDPTADTVANVTTVATLTTYTGDTPQTGDNFARLGAPVGASVSADIAVIEAQTDDIGVAGAGLTAIPWNAAWDAEVESEVNDALDSAIAELGVAAPTATPTIRTGLMLLYMALRNKTVVQTSGVDALEIYNNAGAKIAAKLLTDDGSDYTEAEMA